MSQTHGGRETVRFDEVSWVPPAESVDHLPLDAAEGAMCYVQSEDAVYAMTNGIWVKKADLQGG